MRTPERNRPKLGGVTAEHSLGIRHERFFLAFLWHSDSFKACTYVTWTWSFLCQKTLINLCLGMSVQPFFVLVTALSTSKWYKGLTFLKACTPGSAPIVINIKLPWLPFFMCFGS